VVGKVAGLDEGGGDAMSRVMRWLVGLVAALVAFGGCWAGLEATNALDRPDAIGVAAVPLVILLAVVPPWAESARRPEKAIPATEQHRNILNAGETLQSGQSLYSTDRGYRLDMQADGNLVVRKADRRGASWASKTAQTGSSNYLKMRDDGNLVVYTAEHRPVWESKTANTGGNRVVMQDDGNLVVYTAGGGVVWASHTDLIMGIFKRLFGQGKPERKDSSRDEKGNDTETYQRPD